jgi:hypothetical protein
VVVVVLLTVAGDHVPVIPFVEAVGRTGATDPLQIGAITANVAVMLELTVISNVAVVAHCPAFGVKVYVPEVVLLTVAGDHVPVIPFVEVAGKTGAVDPEHIGAIAANVGTAFGFTVTINVVVVAHCPAFGVKV